MPQIRQNLLHVFSSLARVHFSNKVETIHQCIYFLKEIQRDKMQPTEILINVYVEVCRLMNYI